MSIINSEKFFVAMAFTGFMTIYTGFWGNINTEAIAASYNANPNNSVLMSSDLTTELSNKLSSNLASAIDKQNRVSNLPPTVVTAIQNDLRRRANLEPGSYTITRATQRTWSDGCLGLGGPAEGCLAALTPGWRVVVTSNNGRSTWVFRTNQDGSSVRLAPPR